LIGKKKRIDISCNRRRLKKKGEAEKRANCARERKEGRTITLQGGEKKGAGGEKGKLIYLRRKRGKTNLTL